MTLDDQNSLVIDAQGRKNGIDKNGKRHLETPGAQLVKTEGREAPGRSPERLGRAHRGARAQWRRR